MDTVNFTPALLRVIKFAKEEAARQGMYVGVEHVLIGMVQDGQNIGAMILEENRLSIDRIRRCDVSNLTS